jgi:TonB-linked SusC/RagA family outer membrane protein
MKKNDVFRHYSRNVWKKTLMVMKLTTFFLLLGMFSISAKGFGQGGNISLRMEQVSLESVLQELKLHADYTFVYGDKQIENVQFDLFEVENANLEVVMEECLKGTNLEYYVVDDVVILREKLPISSEETKQEKKEVKGKVTDEQGFALPGVSVIIKGTNTGVATDIDGNYAIEMENGNGVLVFSFVGMIPQEIAYNGQSVINVNLKTDSEQMEEVVVVGYGSTKRERIGSAISEIKSEEIEAKSIGVTGVENILGGNIKGLQISQSSGAPGSGATIRVRGITSPFTGGNNQPLYVVDGVEFNTDSQAQGVSQNILESINPSDIKSISVLKDAGATAIYGSRGANGVIIITTKRGARDSRLNVSFDASMSISNPIKEWDLLDAQGFKELHQMIAKNTVDKFGATNHLANLIYDATSNTFNDSYYDMKLGKEVDMWGSANTDWQDEVYRKNATVQKYNLTLSGGSKKTNYSGSIYYNDQNGLVINDYQKRYGSRLALDTDVKEWMRFGTSLSVSGSKNFSGRPKQGEGVVDGVIATRPDMAVKNSNGVYNRQIAPPTIVATPTGITYRVLSANPVAQTLNRNVTKALSVFGNAYLEIKPLKDLKLKTELNVSNFVGRDNNFEPLVAQGHSLNAPSLNGANNNYSNSLNTTLNFQAIYHKQFKDHSLNVMAGISSNKSRFESESYRYTDLGDDTYVTSVQSGKHSESYQSKSESIMNSVFSRLQYAYKGKYTLTLNMRSDKSSRFGPGNKRGYFPSAAVNWIISEEGFMKGLTFLDQLKLRGSYGKTGLANISEFTYLRFWETPSYPAPTYMGNTLLTPEGTYPNPNIKWETTKEANFGVDFAFFNNRLSGSIDYYNKQTTGAIMRTPVFNESGSGNMFDNRAEISNKGMEFEIAGDIIRNKDLVWSASFNLAFNRNELESIKGNAISKYVIGSYIEGEPIGTISGLKVDKIIQSQEEIVALNNLSETGLYQSSSTGVGDYLYVDTNKDGKIDDEDKTIIGSQEPDFFGGFSTMLQYKGFTLSAGFQFTVGNHKTWRNASKMYLSTSPFTNMSKEALTNTWTPENVNAKYPRLAYGHGDNSRFKRMNHDVAIQDASYLRLKTLNLSYSLPKNIVSKMNLNAVSVYIGGANLWTLTNYDGLDPETGGSTRAGDTGSILGGAFGSDVYPMAKTYTVGVKIGF